MRSTGSIAVAYRLGGQAAASYRTAASAAISVDGPCAETIKRPSIACIAAKRCDRHEKQWLQIIIAHGYQAVLAAVAQTPRSHPIVVAVDTRRRKSDAGQGE